MLTLNRTELLDYHLRMFKYFADMSDKQLEELVDIVSSKENLSWTDRNMQIGLSSTDIDLLRNIKTYTRDKKIEEILK